MRNETSNGSLKISYLYILRFETYQYRKKKKKKKEVWMKLYLVERLRGEWERFTDVIQCHTSFPADAFVLVKLLPSCYRRRRLFLIEWIAASLETNADEAVNEMGYILIGLWSRRPATVDAVGVTRREAGIYGRESQHMVTYSVPFRWDGPRSPHKTLAIVYTSF